MTLKSEPPAATGGGRVERADKLSLCYSSTKPPLFSIGNNSLPKGNTPQGNEKTPERVSPVLDVSWGNNTLTQTEGNYKQKDESAPTGEGDPAARLSSCHICTPELQYYPDGSMAQVKRARVTKVCTLCGKPFEAVAWRQEHFTICGGCRQEKKTPRGSITLFSKKSRRRLMILANKVRADVKPLFVTATYPDSYQFFNEPKRWKEDLRDFAGRFNRRFGGRGSLVWRLEIEDRKSGIYTGRPLPHFHFLVFGVGLLEFREFFTPAWHEIAAADDPKHLAVTAHHKSVSVMVSKRQLTAYVSKAVGMTMSRELAKDLQDKGVNVGRWWGVIARGVFALFQATAETLKITEKQAVELIRCFRKLARIKGRMLNSFCVFIDGGWLKERLPDLLELGA